MAQTRKRRHSLNHDEVKTQNRVCFCGHIRAEHEIHPDEHCYNAHVQFLNIEENAASRTSPTICAQAYSRSEGARTARIEPSRSTCGLLSDIH